MVTFGARGWHSVVGAGGAAAASLEPGAMALAGVRWGSDSPWEGLGFLLVPAQANRPRACHPPPHPPMPDSYIYR